MSNYINLAKSVTGGVFFKIGALLVSLLISRWLFANLETTDLAVYFLGLAYLGLILQPLNFGIYSLIYKFYTNEQYKPQLPQIWTTLNLFRLATFIFALILVLASYPLVNSLRPEHLPIILLLFVSQILVELDYHYRAVCNAKGNIWQFSLTDLINKLLVLLGLVSGVWLITTNQGLVFYLIILGFANLVTLIIDAVWQRAHTQWGRWNWQLIKDHWPTMIFLGTSGLLVAAYENLDRLILDYVHTPKELITAYANVYTNVLDKAKIIVSLIIPILASNFHKTLSKAQNQAVPRSPLKWVGNKQKLKILSLNLGVTFVVALVITLGTLTVAPIILRFVDSEQKYMLDGLTFTILVSSLLPYFLNMFLAIILNLSSQEKTNLVIELSILILTIAGYWLIIPSSGPLGAATVTFLSYLTGFVIRLIYYAKFLVKT